ncbi:MAG: hypothetical protein ACLTT1_05955 [[Clostridium] scindens]
MAIEVRMKKKLGNFQLDIDFKTDENRIGILGSLRLRKKHDFEMHRRHRDAG